MNKIFFFCAVLTLVGFTAGQSANGKTTFNDINELQDVIRNSSNILLTQIRAVPSAGNLYKAEAMFGSLKVSLQFSWPLSGNGTITLEPNIDQSIPNFKAFRAMLQSQLGDHSPFPLLKEIGIGNYGLSLTTLELKFQDKDLKEVRARVSIKGWGVFTTFYFRVLNPQMVLTFRTQPQRLLGVRSLGVIASLDSMDIANALPVEFILPVAESEPLQVRAYNPSAVISYKHITKFLTTSLGLSVPSIVWKALPNMKITNLDLSIELGLSNVSKIVFEAVASEAWNIGGDLNLHDAELKINDSDVKFSATARIGNQSIRLRYENNHGHTLQSDGKIALRDLEEMVRYLLKKSVAESLVSLPDLSFVRIYGSNLGGWLESFNIAFSNTPKNTVNISLVIKLTRAWGIFDNNLLTTSIKDTAIHLQIISLNDHPKVNANITGTIALGNPKFLEYPFSIQIPHGIQPIIVSLLPGRVLQVNFSDVVNIGGIANFPDAFRDIFFKVDYVEVTELELVFQSNVSAVPVVTAFRLRSLEIWDLNYIRVANVSLYYLNKRYELTGQLEFLGVSTNACLNWPTNTYPVIAISNKIKLKDHINVFANGLSKLLNGEDLRLNLKRAGLENINDCTIQSISVSLAQDLRSVKEMKMRAALPKHSWKLFDDFFAVENITTTLDVVVGRSFAMEIEGNINLVSGALMIPFQMSIPPSSTQNISIGLGKTNKSVIGRFQDIEGFLQSSKDVGFPVVLGSFLPEIHLKNLEIAFTKSSREMKVMALHAQCPRRWNVGDLGILHVDNLRLNMTDISYDVCGSLIIGGITFDVQFISNAFQKPMFRLLKPVTFAGVSKFIAETFRQVLPKIKQPNGNLLGLADTKSEIQQANLYFSKDLKRFTGLEIEIRFLQDWSFFRKYFTMKHIFLRIEAKDFYDIKVDYEITITGIMELARNGRKVSFPLKCNIINSVSLSVVLELTSPVTIEMSDVSLMPLVGRLIPSGLINPVSHLIGPIRINTLSAHFKSGSAGSLSSLLMSTTALNSWKIPGLLTFQNMTFKIWYSPYRFKAQLSGKIMILRHPLSFRIPFDFSYSQRSPRPRFVSLQFLFRGISGIDDFPDGLSLDNIANRLLPTPNFDLKSLFPDVFAQHNMTFEKFNLRIVPPLTRLTIDGFDTKFHLLSRINLINNWLAIEKLTVDIDVQIKGDLRVSGVINCLVRFGSSSNSFSVWSSIVIPTPPSRNWILKLVPDSSTTLTLAKAASVLFGGIDIKSFFPTKWLAKVTDIQLSDLEITFRLKPTSRIQRVKCLLLSDLSDIDLPIKLAIKNVKIYIDILFPFDSANRKVNAHLELLAKIGKTTIQTSLYIKPTIFYLEAKSLISSLDIEDLASLVGGDALLRLLPKGLIKVKSLTLNKLNITFRKPNFELQDIYIICDLNGFDAGFSFPLPLPDPKNMFRAELKVSKLELAMKRSTWSLNADITASISGLSGKVDAGLKNLEAVLKISPDKPVAIEIKKTILDLTFKVRLGGMDLNLRIHFHKPKIIFPHNDVAKISADIDVSGFHKLNMFFPFNVFDNEVKMAVLIQQDDDRPLRIQMKTLPILEHIIPCKKLGEGEFKCDFTWLCNSDSYVSLKSPSFSYTENGFESSVDVQGLDKLCIPITPRFLWKFIERIPILGRLFPKNFPLWPPPNIKKLLRNMFVNINNLPKGMEKFIEPKFPKLILASVVVPHEGPLQLSIKVANGESLIVPNVLGLPHLMSGVIFRELTIGTFFGIPFVNVDMELYIWNLLFLVPLSHLPKQNPLLINAMDFETRIICKDCYFVILGAIPIPIFASPFHLSFPLLNDVQPTVTIYHKRPGFKDFAVFASLLKGLFKFFTEKDYLLSINDFGGVNASKNLLVVKLNHENYKTMVQLPKYMRQTQLLLDLPPLDAKTFLIGYLNFFKTFKLKWLLRTVPLKYRIIDSGINIGAFKLLSLKFAASTPDELKNNKDLWNYPVVSTGDDALVIASLHTSLLSLDFRIKAKTMINADLNFTLEAGFTDVVKIDLDARAMINLEDMSNPLLLGGRCSLYLFGTKLLAGSAYVSVREIRVSGQLKFNFLGLLKFHGFVKASFRSGEFLLSSKVGLEFAGINFFDSNLRIRNSLRVTEVAAKTSFMGSSLQIELIRNGLSFKVKGIALINIGVNIDLGELTVFGKSLGRIKLNAGVLVDLKVSLPGKSSLLISFYFLGEKFSLPKLEVDTKDCRPDRIPRLVLNWLREKALSLIKNLFLLNPGKYLKALMDGAIKFGKAAIKIVKDLLKAGHKFIGSVVKEIGKLANQMANAGKEVAKAAKKAKEFVMKSAKAVRETAEKAVKVAKKAVKAIGNVVRDVGKKLGQVTEDLANAIIKVVRLENVVKQAKKIVKAIVEGIKDVARKIEKIAKKIFDEIAKGIRNAVGKIVKFVGGWLGKRSLYYRRDVLTSEKNYFERRKAALESKQSNTRTKLRVQERELKQATNLERMKSSTRNKVKQESNTANKHLEKAIRDDIEKTAFVEDLQNQGKCVTGENNCHPNATCLRAGNHGETFKCFCRRGWIGDGITCETPIREVSVVADEASAVGEAVNFAAFTISGTNVEYKFSFQGYFSKSSYQTYIFNKSGVYKVGVFARNTVSDASDETSVVIQEPVSNIKLIINGDKRPCRPLEFVPTSVGTNVTFDVRFGDNTTLYNKTKSITHYYRLSGTYNVTVIARNLVSSVNNTYVLNIRGTPCDQLYCDISELERKSEQKSLQNIANLAWEMAKSSRDVITYSDPPAWIYFAALHPMSTKNLNKQYNKSMDQKRMYSINSSDVDMALVYAGITASLMEKDAVFNDESEKNHCRKPPNVTTVLILDGLLDVQEKDILNSWRSDMDNDYYCHEKALREARIRGSVDGYLLGDMLVNSTFKMSDVLYNYYCPNLENAIPLPFVNNERYDVLLETLRTKFPQKNRTLFHYFRYVVEQIKNTSKYKNVHSGSNCLRFLVSYLSKRIKQKSDQNIVEDPCGAWKRCGDCLSFGGKDNCSWCAESSKCIQKVNNSACKPLEHITSLPCPSKCSEHSNCQECMQNQNCGWCSSVNVRSSASGFCREGNKDGPLQPGFCNKKDWFKGQCGRNCYTDKKCSGRFGKCRSGKCVCVTGYYGPGCSKLGCIYRIGFKDTADSIARLFHIRIEDLPFDGDERLILAPNAVTTIPVSNSNKMCLNHPRKATFHPLFPRILRGSKNLVNKKSYCGLYGSLAKRDDSLFCKNVTDEEQCKGLAQCTWNVLDPCTGVPVEGCHALSTKTQLLVPQNMEIASPISGNIETGKDFALISGWPGSDWENCTVKISRIRPLNITSVLAGQTLGLGALEGNPMLPIYFEVALTRRGSKTNPEEHLLPCAPGCAQLDDLGNGICDTSCNVSECNFDDGDCLNESSLRRKIAMPQNMQLEIYTDKSWHVLNKLYEMTREHRIEVTKGPLSVFGLSESIVSEMLVSSAIPSALVYDRYRATLTKHFKALLAKNSTRGQMIIALARQLAVIGSDVSPYMSSNEEYQTIDINMKSLKHPKEFERALQVLQGFKQLIYSKVEGNFSGSYFHVEIVQQEHEVLCSHHRYRNQSTENKCGGVFSCSGHGICSTQGSCLCDADYEGLDCKTSKCPNNCSSHGTCIQGECVCERGWKGKDCSTVKLCTELCLDIWIGDGTCDSSCNIPLCKFDGTDCLNVCTCPKSWLGDGSCDLSCNTTVCDHDEGDCVKTSECSQGCTSSMAGDGFCDRECNTESCSFDNGDCEMKEACNCDLTLQGNGVCNAECNNKECMFDFGDCVTEFQVSNLCPKNCFPSMVGNGFCDLICNVSACGFDGQDCIKHESDIKSPCSPGCLPVFLKDGSCDSVCNVKACNYDEGDCPKPIVEMCHTGCTMAMVGDGKCQPECSVSQCSYDATDCECSPGCPHSSIGNGKCEPKCLTATCFYDKEDCTCPPEKCPEEIIGDGFCNEQCNNRICDFDDGDCNCVPGCSINSINDGWCDKECDVKECSYDGLDCGACRSDSHLNLCDQNAECITVNDSLPFIRCQCKTGYYGDGYQCIERGKCFNRSEVCSKNAECLNMSGTFQCYCNKGFKGNGVFCENIDECVTNQHNCSNKALCIDRIGNYTCTCLEGYSGDGLNCYDINECEARSHTCCANEKCINTIGSYNCVCGEGWAEANTTNTEENKTNKSMCTWITNPPSFVNEKCVDVDECVQEVDNCSRINGVSNAQCQNTIGGFNCTCNAGWRGDGWFCTDVDECDYSDICGENQVCNNTQGSFLCSCKEGWIFNQTGSGECEDIDECALGIDKCSEFATCTNTNGSFNCDCRDGFEDTGKVCTNYRCGNSSTINFNTTANNITNDVEKDEVCKCMGSYRNVGRQCADIDECTWETNNCPVYAPVCINNLGGYECQCDAMDNNTCEVFNPCNADNNTCGANMTCVVSGLDHFCVCPIGYIEDSSETSCVDRNECLSPDMYKCPDNAECVNTAGSYECKCREGFYDSGGSCFEINECDATLSQRIDGRLQECKPGICASEQTCIYHRSANKSQTTNTSIVCACDQDSSKKLDCVEIQLNIETDSTNRTTTVLSLPWHTMYNSTNSSSPLPPMFRHNCSASISGCENTLGSYKCICNPGYYSNDSMNCHDEDECKVNGTCHPNASCNNTIGSFECSCIKGFTGDGKINCTDINECNNLGSSICHGNATCINTEGSYICRCKRGYQGNGTFCKDIDECVNSTMNNCHPRAVCRNYDGGYVCECTKGYSGDGFRCADIDECSNVNRLCGSHATCYNIPGAYICKCNPGWTGDGQNCTNINECQLGTHSCIENSQCQDYAGGYACTCNKGWTRQWFEPYGRCSGCDSSKICSGRGQCLRDGSCDCFSYFGGNHCSVCNPDVRCSGRGSCDINGTCYCERGWTRKLDCSTCVAEDLCSGHGQCNYDLNTYSNTTCYCNDGYNGENCSKACPIIGGEVCGIHGDCPKHYLNPQSPCICHTGYQWNNPTSSCVDVNECTAGLHDCVSPAICVNTPGSYRCKCPSLVGWSLIDGRWCNDTDECQYAKCDVHATCQNYPGGFRCNCNVGWRGSGEHPVCTDINECTERTHACSAGSTCVNTAGSYRCICSSGYEKVSKFQCVDVNECSRGIHGCDPNARCINTVGSWRCQCNNGWYPVPTNARLPVCRDVNECVDKPGACPHSSTCVNTAGSYHCNCLPGWTNRGPHACTDVNECTRNPCPANSRCINTQGSYKCYCNSGYRPRPPVSATTCNDINECASGTYSCPAHSRCVNQIGSYRCDCIRCYHRYGSDCRADCRTETRSYGYYTTTYYASYYTTSCGFLGLSRCTRSRQRTRRQHNTGYQTVHVAQRPGASCPCS